jgi:periplasmic protein TonB
MAQAPALALGTQASGGYGTSGVPGGTAPELALPAAPIPAAKKEPAKQKILRIGGHVMEAKMVKRVLPVYPPLAKQARIGGTVRLEGVISREGRVTNLQVISGHPLLIRAAVEAVSQWVYQPTLLNHEPVDVIAPIEVNFVLSQ